MYPWYRDNQIGVGQFCGPISATIKTESVGYNDCMLAIDYAAQNKVSKSGKSESFLNIFEKINHVSAEECLQLISLMMKIETE